MGGMDKGTVIQRALEKLGEREYVEKTATEDPVRRAYDIVVRRCNGRYKWSFARVVGRRVKVQEREGKHWKKGYYVELPDDCLLVESLTDGSGEKVRHSEFCIEPEERKRIVLVEGVEKESDLYLNYTADIVTLGGVLPDSAPYFCEGVICELAAELAISVVSSGDLAAAYKAEARENLQRAMDIDARQWKSNDQHPMREILRSNILWR